MNTFALSAEDQSSLRHMINEWATELGFQQIGVTNIDLGKHTDYLKQWLAQGYHGQMNYMTEHGDLRTRPDKLQPGTLSVISARMDYLAPDVTLVEQLGDKSKAYISRYALGRDYHKLIRKRLTRLGEHIQQHLRDTGLHSMGYRAFVDSAPVLERALANKAGLGWIGKNTMLINRTAGSYFFLGEVMTNLPLPPDQAHVKEHCGRCTACLDICPTRAFAGPYVLDARRCISYLTIELKGVIPVELRKGIGNRIFGCDDCQIGCPWNRFSNSSTEQDFSPRHQLDKATLLELFAWDEATFLQRTEGMPIRRTGFESWQRNIAVALGNAPSSIEVVTALQYARKSASPMLQEHIDWALKQHFP